MLDKLGLIPLIPFLGFLINGLFGRKNQKTAVSVVAVGAAFASAICASIATYQYAALYHHGERHLNVVWNWFNAGGIGTDVAFQLDPLSIVMVLVVTWVGALIHLYSVGYMWHEDGYARYFAYLNLFLAAMLILVLGSSYLFIFVGWEGVGLCSYLLIGYYYEKDFAAAAGKKAFIVNRIGDFGFLIAMFLMFSYFGTVDFAKVGSTAMAGGVSTTIITAICLFLFLGACGKSAQIPLYVWLPDAMAGPTPVSALIHAATMVTAGVYLVARTNILYRMSPTAMIVVSLVGAATALFAATIGIRQWDIKKVLAYSTVSQLGFMFIGVGVGAYTAGIFHLVTHAFFKACLFLGSGSVIHAMSGEQDIRFMGGLRKKIPITYWTFLIATIAIAGFPPFSGFFSKDEILGSAMVSPFLPQNVRYIVWALGSIAAFCTAYYMFRLVFLTFFGEFRGTHEQEHHLHESPWTMTLPLILLAFGSLVGGALNWPGSAFLHHWLAPLYPEVGGREGMFEIPHHTEYILWGVATFIAAAGTVWAYLRFYKRGLAADESFERNMPAIAHGMENKWYVDEAYDATIITPLNKFSKFLWKGIDAIIDGLIALMGYIVAAFGDIMRFLQTGYVRNYAMFLFLGVMVLVWIYV